jgi:predicted RecB family nuclease
MKTTGQKVEQEAADELCRLERHGVVAHATVATIVLEAEGDAGVDRSIAEGALPKPKLCDPFLQTPSERGATHEQRYVEHLTNADLEIVRIDGIDLTDNAVAETRAAMHRGVPVIAQAALSHQGWNGRADILRRIEVASALGGWCYELIDTKLARETKAGTVLQLCLYLDLLAEAPEQRTQAPNQLVHG